MWTIIKDAEAHRKALELARGSYQRDLLNGYENLSGSSLRGKARQYAGRYQASARNLLARMTAAGIHWSESVGAHNARLLVIGA